MGKKVVFPIIKLVNGATFLMGKIMEIACRDLDLRAAVFTAASFFSFSHQTRGGSPLDAMN